MDNQNVQRTYSIPLSEEEAENVIYSKPTGLWSWGAVTAGAFLYCMYMQQDNHYQKSAFLLCISVGLTVWFSFIYIQNYGITKDRTKDYFQKFSRNWVPIITLVIYTLIFIILSTAGDSAMPGINQKLILFLSSLLLIWIPITNVYKIIIRIPEKKCCVKNLLFDATVRTKLYDHNEIVDAVPPESVRYIYTPQQSPNTEVTEEFIGSYSDSFIEGFNSPTEADIDTAQQNAYSSCNANDSTTDCSTAVNSVCELPNMTQSQCINANKLTQDISNSNYSIGDTLPYIKCRWDAINNICKPQCATDHEINDSGVCTPCDRTTEKEVSNPRIPIHNINATCESCGVGQIWDPTANSGTGECVCKKGARRISGNGETLICSQCPAGLYKSNLGNNQKCDECDTTQQPNQDQSGCDNCSPIDSLGGGCVSQNSLFYSGQSIKMCTSPGDNQFFWPNKYEGETEKKIVHCNPEEIYIEKLQKVQTKLWIIMGVTILTHSWAMVRIFNK